MSIMVKDVKGNKEEKKMLKVGKLDSGLLQKLIIDKLTIKRKEVITHSGIGEDCAVIDYGDYDCVVSTDPITASVEEIGRLAVHVSCNDVATNGIEPIGIMLAVLLPKDTTEEQVEKMMNQVGEASSKLGVEIIGGHTEITTAVKQPLLVSTAIGRAKKGTVQSAKNMQEGDALIVTKQIGLEGTGIIATEKDLSGILTENEVEIAKSMLQEISVVREGLIAGGIGTHGMHDVTEGGILGAVWEMCHVAELGAEIQKDSIPINEVTAKISSYFNIDAYRLISSGCMLICCGQEKKDEIIKMIKSEGIDATCIGKIKNKKYGIRFKDGGIIDPPSADEIYKVVG